MALTLHYDFASDKSLGARVGPTLSITRTTDATYVDSAGLIATASSGEARFTHDADGNSLGLFVEESRTNLCLYSEDLSNAAWVASNVTKGSDSVTAPDGAANTAVRLTASDANGTVLQSITSASANRSYAVYIKRVTGTGDIDLTVDGGSNWSTVAVTAEWTRFDIQQSAVTNPQVGVRIVTDTDAIDFWGSNLETGAYPSSYIPTEGSTVTRNADVLTSSDVTWINSEVGTFYGKFQTNNVVDGSNPVIGVSEADIGVNSLIFYASQDDMIFTSNIETGADGDITDTAVISANTVHQYAIAYAQDDMQGYVDGSSAGSDNTCDFPHTETWTRFKVGNNQATSKQLDGIVQEIRYYDERLDNDTLEDFSNGIFPGDEMFYLEVQRRQAANLGKRPAPFKPGRRGGLRDL